MLFGVYAMPNVLSITYNHSLVWETHHFWNKMHQKSLNFFLSKKFLSWTPLFTIENDVTETSYQAILLVPLTTTSIHLEVFNFCNYKKFYMDLNVKHNFPLLNIVSITWDRNEGKAFISVLLVQNDQINDFKT